MSQVFVIDFGAQYSQLGLYFFDQSHKIHERIIF